MDKDSLKSISNLINLKDLNNASILHNLRKRFKEVCKQRFHAPVSHSLLG